MPDILEFSYLHHGLLRANGELFIPVKCENGKRRGLRRGKNILKRQLSVGNHLDRGQVGVDLRVLGTTGPVSRSDAGEKHNRSFGLSGFSQVRISPNAKCFYQTDPCGCENWTPRRDWTTWNQRLTRQVEESLQRIRCGVIVAMPQCMMLQERHTWRRMLRRSNTNEIVLFSIRFSVV